MTDQAAPSLLRLYRQTVLRHSREPHNRHAMAEPCFKGSKDNPLCGDRYTVYLHERDGMLTAASFEGDGCAISLASASMLTSEVQGLSVNEARRLAATVIETMGSGGQELPGELAALGEIHAYPARLRCATLAWKALEAALDTIHTTTATA